MPDPEFRPGAHDLETPLIFVPRGAPDPIEFKRKYPGWVSFPATFVPHPRPIPKWKIINGQRWPLDKKGRPWPKTRYGRPTCPFDELPPGMPAPGTQYELLRKFDHPTLFWEGEPMPTVAEVLAIGAKARAERAAAAPPPPIEPQRAYDGDGMGPARDYLAAMDRVSDAMRQAAEDAAFWSAAPPERIQMSDDILNRNSAAVLAATRTVEPRPFLFTAAMEGQPGETTKPAAVHLPPGTYHEPLVPLMNRILAVREGDDVGALRREISNVFYSAGDTTGGNQVNMYLSELAEPGVTDAQRREIAEALAHYAKADPEQMGRLRQALTLGGAAISKGPRAPGIRDGARITVDQGQQGKHVAGSRNHDPARSTLTADPQNLLDTYSGKGQPANNMPRGQPGFRERFDTQGTIIGIFRDERIGIELPTTRGIIHYSKRGAHIFPSSPNLSRRE